MCERCGVHLNSGEQYEDHLLSHKHRNFGMPRKSSVATKHVASVPENTASLIEQSALMNDIQLCTIVRRALYGRIASKL